MFTKYFLATLIKHIDLQSFGLDKCLQNVVHEIIYLKIKEWELQQKITIFIYILFWV